MEKYFLGINNFAKTTGDETRPFFENNRFPDFCLLASNEAWYFLCSILIMSSLIMGI